MIACAKTSLCKRKKKAFKSFGPALFNIVMNKTALKREGNVEFLDIL